jgi:hypothetical protein
MLVAQLVGYSVFYACASPLFRGQNYLPAVPLAALLAALALSVAGEGVVRWAPPAVYLRGTVLVLVVAASLASQASAVYAEAVPTSWQAATHELAGRLQPLVGRVVVMAPGEGRLLSRALPGMVVIPAGESAAPSASDLDAADAEVFPIVGSSDAARVLRRRYDTAPPDQRREITSAWMVARGEPVGLLLHPWSSIDRGEWTAGAGSMLPLPATAPGERLSIEVELRAEAARHPPSAVRLEPSGVELPLYFGGWLARERTVLGTARFDPGAARSVHCDAPGAVFAWRVERWRQPQAGR